MLRKNMAFSSKKDNEDPIQWAVTERYAFDQVTEQIYDSELFRKWFNKQEERYAALGHISSDEMRAHYRLE